MNRQTHTLTMEYGSTKKNEIMLFAATWIDLAIIILSEVKSDRERQIPHDIIYMWNLKKKRNYLQNRNRSIDMENKIMATKGEEVGRRIN